MPHITILTKVLSGLSRTTSIQSSVSGSNVYNIYNRLDRCLPHFAHLTRNSLSFRSTRTDCPPLTHTKATRKGFAPQHLENVQKFLRHFLGTAVVTANFHVHQLLALPQHKFTQALSTSLTQNLKLQHRNTDLPASYQPTESCKYFLNA